MLEEKIIIKPLGAGNEVGRSCIHLKYGNKEFLLDCGVHPAYTGVSSLPFLDLVDLSKIDAILVTHFHLDHAAALPFLTEKTEFKGKVYMTHPTKAILKWLLNDYIRIINSSSEQDFYTEKDLVLKTHFMSDQSCFEKLNFKITHGILEKTKRISLDKVKPLEVRSDYLKTKMFNWKLMQQIKKTNLSQISDDSPVKQSDINEELKRHGHQKSRK